MASRLIALLASALLLTACAGSTASAPTTTTAPTPTSEPATSSTTLPQATSTSTTVAAPSTTTSSTSPASTTTTTEIAPVTDALHWARVPLNLAALDGALLPRAAAVPGGTGVVTVGADVSGEDWDAAVWFSADGVTRERVPHDEGALGGPGDQAMVGVVTLGSRLVAVGYERKTGLVVVDGVGTTMESQVYDAAVWTSLDGIAWVRVADEGSVFSGADAQDDQVISAVTLGGPGLVAVGYERDRWYRPEARFNVRYGIDSYAAAWISADGTTWERLPNLDGVFGTELSDSEMRGVAAWRAGLVAVGKSVRSDTLTSGQRRSEAAVWTSADGVTWSRVPPDETVFGGALYEPGVGNDLEIWGVAAGGPGLVAVGRDHEFWWDDAGAVRSDVDAAVWVSADGVVWSRVPHDEEVFGGDEAQEMNTIVAGPFGLVALGFDYSLSTPDSVMWVSPPPG